MASEPMIESTEVDTAETLDFVSDDSSEEVSENKEGFWEAFDDEKAESLTTVWVCDISFDVPDQGIARDIFACTTKEKVVNRLFSIIASPD